MCTERKQAEAKREKKSIEQSLEPAEVPKSETLPAGLFTRIRTGKSKGRAIAACAANEWLTGGACSPAAGHDARHHSAPEPGPDGTARGGRWVCTISYADADLTASAICATVRESTAESQPDAGPQR